MTNVHPLTREQTVNSFANHVYEASAILRFTRLCENSVHGWTGLTTNGFRRYKSRIYPFALSFVEGLLRVALSGLTARKRIGLLE